jgi:hypothetical protein
MQEDERLLMNDDKKGVKEFGELGQDEQLDPESGTAAPIGRLWIQTEIIAYRVGHQVMNQLWPCPQHSNAAKGGQEQIPGCQRIPPLPFGVTLPILPAELKVPLSQTDTNHVQHTSTQRNERMLLHPMQHRNRIVVLLITESDKVRERVRWGQKATPLTLTGDKNEPSSGTGKKTLGIQRLRNSRPSIVALLKQQSIVVVAP